MTPEQFQRLLDKFSRGQCTPEEEQLIIDWYERIGEPGSTVTGEEENADVEEKIWSVINPNPEKAKTNRLPYIVRAAVITIPLLAFAVIYFNRQSITALISPREQVSTVSETLGSVYINDTDKPLSVPLSDGSVVILQPSSELVLSRDFGVVAREVHLNGEGFFDVKRSPRKPFLVYANEVVTRVLGTSFHIRAYENDGEVVVAVRSGRVSVYANKNKTSRQAIQSPEVILLPNQQMVYNRVREVISKTIVAEPEIVVPNSNLFRMQFDNAEVSEIFKVLTENYGIQIRYDEKTLRNCRLTTSMSDEGLYERIEVICKAIGASYSIDDDAAIIIKSNGC